MTTALITGFGPFPRVPRNPSQILVERLPDSIAGVALHRRILPTEYRSAGPLIESLLADLRPDLCLCIGVAHRGPLRLETTARNSSTAETPDQSGFVHVGPIDGNGAETYASTLPLGRIYDALTAHGHDVTYSDDAGCYVCNYIFYKARRHIDRLNLATACGFLHIPELTAEQDEEAQLGAWRDAVETILKAALFKATVS